MTKFAQKSFSVYNNYAYVPKCQQCGKEGMVFYQSVEGKVCSACHELNKRKRLLERINKNA